MPAGFPDPGPGGWGPKGQRKVLADWNWWWDIPQGGYIDPYAEGDVLSDKAREWYEEKGLDPDARGSAEEQAKLLEAEDKMPFLTEAFLSQWPIEITRQLPFHQSTWETHAPIGVSKGYPHYQQDFHDDPVAKWHWTENQGQYNWTPGEAPARLTPGMLWGEAFPDELRKYMLPHLGESFQKGPTAEENPWLFGDENVGGIGKMGGFNPWGDQGDGGWVPYPSPGPPNGNGNGNGKPNGNGNGKPNGNGNGNGNGPGGQTPWDPDFDAWPGYPNINYPGRNPVGTPGTEGYLPGYNFKQYAHTSRQPDPMWGGGPQSWNSGWPESNAWLGGMQPLMANDPWALTESGIQAGMLPPTTENFFGGYWGGLSPPRDYTRFGDPGSLSSPWGPGWLDYNIGPDVQWENVPYTGWSVPGTELPRPVIPTTAGEPGDAAGEPGDNFMKRAGVTQEQYNLAQDPGAWRGGQTFGQRTGMSQEAFNTARNAAAQAAVPGGYGQPVQGPGQFGGAFGTFDPTTEFGGGQQGEPLPSGYGQPVRGPGQFGGAFGTYDPAAAFTDRMGVTQQQYNLAQNPGAWRGDQSFGERVGMSQEAFNTARNRAMQMNKYGQPVEGPGQFGGAFGTFGPEDVGRGMVHPSRRASPAPTQAAAAAAEPGVMAQPTGAGQITPGVLGGMGTVPGSLSPITPGTYGANAMQPEPTPHTPFFGAPSGITPGTLGGMGTMPQSLSSITPGTYGAGMQQQEAPQGQWNYQGMFSPQQNRITPGTLGGRGTMPRRSSITPGRLGGGNMYGNQQRGF